MPFAFVLGTGRKPGDAQVPHCGQPHLGKGLAPPLMEAGGPSAKGLEGTLVLGNLLEKPPVYRNSMWRHSQVLGT